MKNLIINADDLALTRGVTRGIIDAHLHGIVTSTSILMNSPDAGKTLKQTRQAAPALGIGMHLVLTKGKPLLPTAEVPSLVDASGNFLTFEHFLSCIENINLDDVRREWQAQIESFITYGHPPDHLDSHHHSSYANPELLSVMLDLAQSYRLPIRYPPHSNPFPLSIDDLKETIVKYTTRCPQTCITSFYGTSANMGHLEEILSSLPDGTSELMCHPGFADAELMEASTYNTARETELQLLMSKEAKAAIDQYRIVLGNFSDLLR